MKRYALMILFLICLIATSLSAQSTQGKNIALLSYGKIRYDSMLDLNVFHTGAPMHALLEEMNPSRYTLWTSAREAGILKFSCHQGDYNTGTVIHENGSVGGYYANGKLLELCDGILKQDITPQIETTRIMNFENLTETAVRNFLQNWGNWIETNHPNKFVIWNPACEFNHPDGDPGWGAHGHDWSWKIDYRDFNPQMKMIRRIRDELGLQDMILICIHATPKWSFLQNDDWKSNNWLTGFRGIEEYLEGFAQGDIFGLSHYKAYKNPVYNPNNMTWQETLQLGWKRCKIIWEKVCSQAGKTLPFFFVEFSLGSVRKYDKTPIWKEGVTYVYTEMVQNNEWVKGLLWYCGDRIEPDAMEEIVRLGKEYEGYPSA